jgi:hypothetical protein
MPENFLIKFSDGRIDSRSPDLSRKVLSKILQCFGSKATSWKISKGTGVKIDRRERRNKEEKRREEKRKKKNL